MQISNRISLSFSIVAILWLLKIYLEAYELLSFEWFIFIVTVTIPLIIFQLRHYIKLSKKEYM